MAKLVGELRARETAPAAAEELVELIDELEPAVLDNPEADPDRGNAYWRAIDALERMYHPPDWNSVERLGNAYEVVRVVGDLEDNKCYVADLYGNALFAAGRTREAREVLRAADAEFEDALRMRPYLLTRLAQMEKYRGDYGEAYALVERAERARASLPTDSLQYENARGEILAVRTELALKLGNAQEAAVLIREERKLERTGPRLAAFHVLHQADLYLLQAHDDRVATLVEEKLPELGRLPDMQALLRLRLAIAQANQGWADPAAAGKAEENLVLVLEAPGVSLIDKAITAARLAELRLRDGRLDGAAEALDEAADRLARALTDDELGFVKESTYVSAVRSKLTLARTETERRAMLAELETDVARMRDAWASASPRKDGVSFLHYQERWFIVSELIRLTHAVEGPEAALQALHRVQALGSMARREAYSLAPIEEVQRRLTGDGTGLLVYMPGRERSHVFAVDSECVIHEEIAPHREIALLRRTFEEAILRRDDEETIRRSGAALAEILLPAPVRARLDKWKGVTVVGLEILGRVAFEYLPLADGEYLGHKLALGYLGSIPVGMLLADRPDPSEAFFPIQLQAILGDELSEATRALAPQKLADLDLGKDFKLALTEPFGRGQVEFHQGPDATRERLESEDLEDVRMLLILAHGVPLPEGVAIALAPVDEDDDGLVTREELAQTTLPPFVVFASCQAKDATLRRGEDVGASLAGAAFAAGTRAVLSSPFRLELGALQIMLPVLYRRLAAGDSPAEAMRHARIALSKDPDRGHPFYGLLHVEGLAHAPLLRITGSREDR